MVSGTPTQTSLPKTTSMNNERAIVPQWFRYLGEPLGSGEMTVSQYRHLLKWPNNCVVDAWIKATREYGVGLAIYEQLFQATWRFEPTLSKEEFERGLSILPLKILDMLDYADRWEDYIEWFNFLRAHTTGFIREHRDHLNKTTPLERYLIRWEGDYAILNRMCVHHWRYAVVSRKLYRKRAGRPTGNVRHKTAGELGPQQVVDRLRIAGAHWQFRRQAVRDWTARYEEAKRRAESERP